MEMKKLFERMKSSKVSSQTPLLRKTQMTLIEMKQQRPSQVYFETASFFYI